MLILLAAIGIVSIIIGIQGFREVGIPMTKEKRIVGRPARIIGGICIGFGVLCILGAVGFVVWIFIDSSR